MEIISRWCNRGLWLVQSFFVRLRVAQSQRGLAALEYIALAVLLVVVVAGAFRAFGGRLEDQIDGLFDDIF